MSSSTYREVRTIFHFHKFWTSLRPSNSRAPRFASIVSRSGLTRSIATVGKSPRLQSGKQFRPNGLPDPTYISRVMQKELLAKKMVDNGQTILYESPSHFRFLFGAYSAAGVCVVSVYFLFANEFWKPIPGLSWVVWVGNRVGMAAMTFMGGFFLLRTSRLITSIKLKRVNRDVKLLVSVRRTIPFLKQKEITTSPSNFIIPYKLVPELRRPSWATPKTAKYSGSFPRRITNRISIELWKLFAGTRKVFTHEGFLDIMIKGTKGLWKLDSSGNLPGNGKGLLSIVEFEG